ncbi:carbohydrate kinase family protein [Hydrogenophaga soli]
MRIRVTACTEPLPLFDAAATRHMEQLATQGLPPHTLMQRAGQSVADMARAVAPHARHIWIACGPGNNGGDGLMAAALLQAWMQAKGGQLTVTLHARPERLPPDARWALDQARAAGVQLSDAPPEHCDLVIDALLGLSNQARAPSPADPHGLTQALRRIRQVGDTLLCVDTPSDLDAFRGSITIAEMPINESATSIFCLTFLTLKPGLFTNHGQDLAGEVWWDDLGVTPSSASDSTEVRPCARWMPPAATPTQHLPRHASHKGTGGDVWVLGGQCERGGAHMLGAALLAARAALQGGAGRVYVAPLDPDNQHTVDPGQPELMFRHLDLPHATRHGLPAGVWVVGCGGGEHIKPWLAVALSSLHPLVLDADALNHLSQQPSLQTALVQRGLQGAAVTVITPHPLEAARLLSTTTSQVQNQRLEAAQTLAERWGCVCVLKGSGTVVAAPGQMPCINGTGNGKLATAGTGDVLAGLLGALLARTLHGATTPDAARAAAAQAAVHAVALHGQVADAWPSTQHLTASALAQALAP